MPPPSRRRDLDIARLAQQRNHHPHPHHQPPPPSSSSSSRPHHHRPAVLFDPEYSLHECFLEFHGPAESPYAHGVWYLHLYLPADYPFSSPSIGFQNKILHPNIDEASGSICLDVINQTWTPLYSLENIVDCFVPQLLRYANPSDPLNPAAAALAVQRNTATTAGSASSSSSSGLREGYSEAFWSAVKAHMSQHATREAAERALPPRYRSVLQQEQQEMDPVSAAASSAAVGAMLVGAPSSSSVAPLSSTSTSPSSCGGSEVTPTRSTPTPLFVSDHQPKSSKTMMGTGVEESPSGLSAMDSSEEYEPEPLDV